MELDKAIQGRKSVRHFDKKKPSWKDILECIDAMKFAPTAGNQSPLRYILVDDEKKIKQLADAAQQPFVGEAQYVLVLCTDPKLIKNAYPALAEKFCRQQAGAAIQNLLLKIEEKGLETCWVGWFVEYLVKEAIGIPAEVDVEAMFPIGYESKKLGATRAQRSKRPIDNIMYFNKYKNKRMVKGKTLDI